LNLTKRQPGPALSLLLAALTVACYWRVVTCRFVNFDDYYYLVENPRVALGLSWSNVVWAFQTGYFANWHPLTWLSYLADYEIYGLNPGGFHLTNLLFHTANTVLLFLLLKAMTARVWPSAFVAAFFAWHPLHVESVAWISERKDVLSTFFFLLTLLAYVKYARSTASRSRFYVLSLVLFAFALMSKPMVVTLPFLLLLLDYWPLRRISLSTFPDSRRRVPRLVLEKLPFLALTLAASIVTYSVQRAAGAVSSLETIPLRLRLANSVLSYARYIAKTFWPSKLAAIYPYPVHHQMLWVLGPALLLAGLSALVLLRGRRQPFLLTGWFWFLGTLVPVIGLVQVGAQSIADRYMYIPSIGLFILVVWGVEALLASPVAAQAGTGTVSSPITQAPPTAADARRICATAAGLLCLAACLVCSSFQIRYWRDGEHLFRHAVEVVPNNAPAWDWLGVALGQLGRKDEALVCYFTALRLEPQDKQAHYNLGTLCLEIGRFEEAINQFNAALHEDPDFADAHHNLGTALLNHGQPEAVLQHLAKAVALRPTDPRFHQDLGSILFMQSQLDQAILQFRETLRLNPNSAEGHRSLGVALIQSGKAAEALTHLSSAVRLAPDNPDLRFNLGLALLDQNQPAAAEAQFAAGLRLSPQDTRFHYRLAVAQAAQRKTAEAIQHYRESLRLTPDFPEALNELAWLLACNPNPDLRNGAEAVTLAEKACALDKNEHPSMLLTLAAAYAEAGRFSEAMSTAQKAHDLADANSQKDVGAKAAQLLTLFESRHPFRD